jgi:hypothetical protein
MAHRNPVGGRASSGRLCRLGVSCRRRIMYSGRAGREGGGCSTRSGGSISAKVAPEGSETRAIRPSSVSFGVVGINVHPAAQRNDPLGRSVSADLRFHRTVQDPVRNAVRVRPALVSHVVVGCYIVATGGCWVAAR